MAQLAFHIPAPYQGVSQAAPQARRSDQAEALEDCMVAIPQGCSSRAPWTFQGQMLEHPGLADGLFERIDRGGTADVILTMTHEVSIGTYVRLYPLQSFDGHTPIDTLSVSATADAQAYLNYGTPDPKQDLAILTVEDTTFIVNRKRPVANNTDKADARPFEAMVWVRQAAYARTFSVVVTPATGTPVSASLHTPDGTSASDGTYVDTDLIAACLYNEPYVIGGTNGAQSSSSKLSDLTSQGFTVTCVGPIIYISHPTIDFSLQTGDGQGGTAMPAIKDTVQSFSDLPKLAPSGFTVRIVQQGGTDADDFYVKFVLSAGATTGVWEECIAPGADLGLDPKSMPVGLLYNEGSGVWTLEVLDWTHRTTGNKSLVPDPDFIGQTIEDLSFWHNRLALLAGEAVTLSSSEDPLRFYPRTLSTVLDTDPITLISPLPNRSVFRYAINFDTKLVVFGDRGQCQITSDGPSKPGNTRIDLMTTYEFGTPPEVAAAFGQPYVRPPRPQGSNGKVYFMAPRGRDWSSVYELKVDNVINVTDAEDLSTAVPRYYPSGVDRVANCPVNFLMGYGKSGGSQLTMHLFRYAGGERVQNAPFRWNLPTGYTLGGSFFINTRLMVLAARGGKSYLLMADTSPDLIDDGSSRLLTSLDMRVKDTGLGGHIEVNVGLGGDITVWTLPYDIPAGVLPQVAVRAPGGQGGIQMGDDPLPSLPEGFSPPVVAVNVATRQIAVRGDFTGCPVWIGLPYSAIWELSKLYAQAQPGEPIHTGRTSIRRMRADVSGTGFLKAEVTARGRDPRTSIYTGYKLDDPASLYDLAPDSSGVFSFPVMTENEQARIRFIADSHFQARILGVEWVAELNTKAQAGG